MKKIIIGTVLSVATICIFAFAAFAAAPGVVTALELFNSDDAEREKTYAEHPVVVKGIATYVGPDQYSLPSVSLSDSVEGKMYVLCVLPFGDFFKLGDIAVGQEVTFSGELRGRARGEGFIVLKKCVIVEE